MSAKVEANFVKRGVNIFEASMRNVGTDLGGNTQRWSISNLHQSNDIDGYDEQQFTLKLVSGVSRNFNLYMYVNSVMAHSDYRGYLVQEFRNDNGDRAYSHFYSVGPLIALVPQVDGIVVINGSVTKIPVKRTKEGAPKKIVCIKSNVSAVSPGDDHSHGVQLQRSFTVLPDQSVKVGYISKVTFEAGLPNGIAPETSISLRRLVEV